MKSIHRRNIRFRKEISRKNKKRILGVAIDPAKTFHRVILFDFTGKTIYRPFSIDPFKTGYQLLRKKINAAVKRIKAENVYVAYEMPALYSQTLIERLKVDYKNVAAVPPAAVAENRKQRLLQGLKTDDIDAGAVGDLLIRGEFIAENHSSDLYSELRELINFRERKLVYFVTLKNKINFRLDKIYPGLNTAYNEYKKLYWDSDDNVIFKGLIHNRMTGQEILRTSYTKLIGIYEFETRGRAMRRLKMLKERLRLMLLPKEKVAKMHLELLRIDVNEFNILVKEMNRLEERIIDLAKRTPAAYLMKQIKGVTDIYAAIYIGLIGDIRRYSKATHIFSKSGLSPTIHQSGMNTKQLAKSRKVGDRMLRTHLFRMAGYVKLHEPVFKEYAKRLEDRDLHWKKRRVAVANKLNRVLFALIRDKKDFKDAIGSTNL